MTVSTVNIGAFTVTTLKPGQRKNVGVVHVNSPHNFFVHLTEQSTKLQNMTDSLASTYDSGSQPELREIIVGACCCAKYTEDQAWYRAKVTAVNGNEIEVLFVDFGNKDLITKDSVRELKKEFLDCPTLAIPCSLNNVKSASGVWTDDEIDHFTNVTLDVCLELHVVSSIMKDGETVVVGNLLEGPERTSIAQKLVDDGKAALASVDVCTELPDLDIAPESTSEVKLTWFVSPTNFYVQKNSHGTDSLDVLMREMQEFYSFPENLALAVPRWADRVACVARFTEDDVWYRAEIFTGNNNLKIDSGKIAVMYVDFGNREIISRERVCGLAPKFAKLPAQAIHCRLQSVRPVGQKWLLIPQANLDMYFSSSGTMVTFHGSHKRQYLVDVETNGRGLAQELVSDGYATFTSSTPSITSTTSSGEVPVKQDVSNPFPTLKMDWVKGEYKDVIVCSLGQINRFWCQLIKTEELSLTQQLDSYYEKLGPTEQKLANPKRGTPCVVRSARNGHWYRAVVQNRLSSVKLSVLCVDTGMDEIIPITQAKVISAEFIKIPVEAFPCSLYGVPEAGADPDEFIRATYLKELVAQLENVNGDTYEVTLFDVADSQEKNLNEILIAIASDEVPSTTELVAPYPPPNMDWTVGEDKMVVISDLGRPDNFWCQLVTSEAELELLCQKLEEHYGQISAQSLKISKFTPCLPCVMKSSINNKWYRASVIQQLSMTEVKLLLIDLGLIDDVDISEIKEITPEFLQSPRQAFQCCLSGLETENINNSVVGHFFSLVGEQLTAKLEKCLEKGVYEISLWDQSSENPESILSRLTGREDDNAESGIQFPPPDVLWEIGEVKDVVVSGLGLPDNFWCQLLSDNAKMNDLSSQMAEYYEDLTVDKLSVLVPVIGKAVAVQSRDTKKWYRAVISTITKSTKIMATLVDTGEWEKFTLSQVKTIAPEFVSFPVMALECELSGLPPNAEVRKMAYDFFNLTVDKQLKARLDGRKSPSSPFQLTLFDLSSGQEVNVNELLVDIYQGRCSSTLTLDVTNHAEIENPIHFNPPAIPLSGIHECYISHINSPKHFYIQLKTIEETLNHLVDDLNAAYSPESLNNNLDLPTGALPGLACCAPYGEEETWYRGELVALNGNSLTIKFIDYGNTEAISRDKVKTLLPRFLDPLPLSIECLLSNAPDYDNWTVEELENFQNMVMDKLLFVEFLTTIQPCRVLLRLEENSTPLALLSRKEEAEEKSDAVFTTVVEKLNDECKEGEEIAAKIEVADPTLEPKLPIDDGVTSEENVISEVSEQKETISVPTQFAYRQFPAGKRLTGGISHTVSPGQFWIQLDDDTSVLGDAADKLEKEYANSEAKEPESESTAWMTTGTPCATRYSQDGGWYRSKVLAVERDDVHVQFVDYGNSDTVHATSVRRLTSELMGFPVMAVQCELAGVEQREDEWTVDAIEEFESLVADKSLLVEFVGPATEEERYVVRLLDMGKDISTELGERGFATLREDYRTHVALSVDVTEEEQSESRLDSTCEGESSLAIDRSLSDSLVGNYYSLLPSQDDAAGNDSEGFDTDHLQISKTETEAPEQIVDIVITAPTAQVIEDDEAGVVSKHSTPRAKPTTSKDEEPCLSPLGEDVGSLDDVEVGLDISIQSGGFDTNSILLDDEEGVQTENKSDNNSLIEDNKQEASKINESLEGDGYLASVSRNLETSSDVLEEESTDPDILLDYSTTRKNLNESCTTVSSSFEWGERQAERSVLLSETDVTQSSSVLAETSEDISDVKDEIIIPSVIEDGEKKLEDSAVLESEKEKIEDTTAASDAEIENSENSTVSDVEKEKIEDSTVSDDKKEKIENSTVSDVEKEKIEDSTVSDIEKEKIEDKASSDCGDSLSSSSEDVRI